MMLRLTPLLAAVALVACGDNTQAPRSNPEVKKAVVEAKTEPTKTAPVVAVPVDEVTEVQKPSLENGAKFYKKCAACHLPAGEGLKGAFPPLQDNYVSLAGTPEGRAYLVAVIVNGLQGELVIDGVTYRGAMIAQGRSKSDQTIADTLNYISETFHPDAGLAPFLGEDVSQIRNDQGRLSGRDVRALRPE